MAYIVIKSNNKQSYTLRNTANKPRVVLKSNSTSYIPLKVGTDTRATRLGFDINGNHYRAGGETTTTSKSSNTTYTYLGAQTYKTSTYSVCTTVSHTAASSDYYGAPITSATITSSYTISATSMHHLTDKYLGNWGGGHCRCTIYNGSHTYRGVYGGPNATTVYWVSAEGEANPSAGDYYYSVTTSVSATISKTSPYGPHGSFTYAGGLVIKEISSFTNITLYTIGTKTVYYTAYVNSTSSYDYGYNIEVGNTTTSVQTTTEV